MEVQMAAERVLRLVPQIKFDDARQLVEDKKVSQVAGTLGALFTRPKPEEIVLGYGECRYEPFWRVTAQTYMAYERQRTFTLAAGGTEVKQITLFGQSVPTQQQSKGTPTITFSGVEHCEEERRLRRYYTGAGESSPELEKYVRYETEEVADLAAFEWEGTCEPPAAKSGAVIRQMMTEMSRPIKAQIIRSERVTIEEIDLMFRPVYAFEFIWAAKNKRVIVECDGLTSEFTNGGKTVKKQLKSLLDRELLFDISADALGTFIPGGGIVVKLTKAAISLKQD